MNAAELDATTAADLLRLPAEQDAWVRGLPGAGAAGPRLPALATAPALLERLAVAPDDAAEILDGWPSPEWPAELSWLLGRVVDTVRADLGGSGWLVPGPSLPRERGPAWRHFYAYVYLALLEDALAYHARHGVPEAVSWATLADLGRNLAIDRRMHGEGWPVMLQWLTLHVRGGIYELGRLQFHRGVHRDAPDDRALKLHIPRSGPLTPEACDASFRRAREFFPRHFPHEPYAAVTCNSWLLDPVLADYLPAESNILRFQRRFEPVPGGGDGGEDVLRFVFGTLSTPLDELPTRTVLQRAVVAHLKAGGRWHNRTGRVALDG
jgi:GNAT-like C-terminal domain/N-acyltransferase N-terminal domain